MGRQAQTEVIFGFMTNSKFDYDVRRRFYDHGLVASPIVWSLEAPEEINGTIIGIEVVSLDGVGQYKEINFDASAENKAKLKTELYKKLDEAGFDVSDKECKLYVNSYFGY